MWWAWWLACADPAPRPWCARMAACAEARGLAWSDPADEGACQDALAAVDTDPFDPLCEDGVPDVFLGPGEAWSGFEGAWESADTRCAGSVATSGPVPSLELRGVDGDAIKLDTWFLSDGHDDVGDTACTTAFPRLVCEPGLSMHTSVTFTYAIEVLDHRDEAGAFDWLRVNVRMRDPAGCEVEGRYRLTRG